MKKKDFIKRFKLIKGEKNWFCDGGRRIERIVYYNDTCAYIFLDGDMYSVNEKYHTIKAGYSWYH